MQSYVAGLVLFTTFHSLLQLLPSSSGPSIHVARGKYITLNKNHRKTPASTGLRKDLSDKDNFVLLIPKGSQTRYSFIFTFCTRLIRANYLIEALPTRYYKTCEQFYTTLDLTSTVILKKKRFTEDCWMGMFGA